MILLLTFAFFFLPSTSWALCRLYITPQVINGAGSKVPKYIDALGIRWDVVRYGEQGLYLVAVDTTTAQDSSLSAQSDVTKIPDNLDAQIGGALTTVQNKLQAVNIPAGWVTSAMTWRTMLRTVIRMMLFLQRFSGVNKIYSAFISGAVTLSTQWKDIPPNAQQQLKNAADSFKFDYSWVTNTTPIGQILKGMADQFQQNVFPLGCATI